MPLSKPEFLEWGKYHVAMFGLKWAEEVDMVSAWYDVLRFHTAEQLRGATQHMAGSVKAFKTADDHRAAYMRALREAIAVNYSGPTPVQEEAGVCEYCPGSGWVSVPHPQAIEGRQWVPQTTAAGTDWHTCAVTCVCWKGRSVWAGFAEAKEKPWRLEFYRKVNPDWRRQMGERRRQFAAEVRAREDGPGGKFAEGLRRALERTRAKAGHREPGCDDDTQE